MADVTDEGGQTYATGLTHSQAVIASQFLSHTRPAQVDYVNAGGGVTVSGNGDAIILSNENPSERARLVGHGHNDILVGNQGNDRLVLTHSGTVFGGNGNDTVSSAGGDVVLGSGNDSVNLSRSGSITVSGSATVSGPGYHATITGGSLSVNISHGEDTITAGSGSATIQAQSHSMLVAGSGQDLLLGNSGGFDTFVGGSGDATMDGGTAHTDLFKFGSAGAQDLILHFLHGDKIELKGLTAAQAFADSTHVTGVGTVIHDGSTTITVHGVFLNASDFKNG